MTQVIGFNQPTQVALGTRMDQAAIRQDVMIPGDSFQPKYIGAVDLIRKLNDCFQEALGTSPLKYLRAVRLNGVRRELRMGAPSVQDVAARWGFWHHGEFAAAYRRQFGELPSQTLGGVKRLGRRADSQAAAPMTRQDQ